MYAWEPCGDWVMSNNDISPPSSFIGSNRHHILSRLASHLTRNFPTNILGVSSFVARKHSCKTGKPVSLGDMIVFETDDPD